MKAALGYADTVFCIENRRAYSPAKGGKKNAFFQKYESVSAVKTALSVGIALAVAQILGSSLPIFAAIGAISVMSRTWSDSLKESSRLPVLFSIPDRMRFVLWLPWRPQFFLWMAVGTLCVITLCIALRLNFAIPLASIVFADVCLYTGGDAVVYGFHRFTDTMVGLAVALVVNIVIRPYNNRQKILNMMYELQKQFLPLLEACDAPLPGSCAAAQQKWRSWTMNCVFFEKQPVALFHHTVRVSARRQEAAYLRGCQQLLDKMGGELAALCNMDSSPVPDDKCLHA
ncbi:MAG: FUSC family protein [Butyricicoccaceae bacterium]